MDCCETVFVDEFWNFSKLSVVLLVLGHPELRHLLTLDRRWNINAIQKPLSGLKNVL
jgi:hypothetical protein